jgi:hypothetical protein
MGCGAVSIRWSSRARSPETETPVQPPLDEEVVQPFGVAFDDDVGVVDRRGVQELDRVI